MVNKAILIGNLAAEPDVRYNEGGDAIASFRIATTETWKKKDGSKEEQTEWHRIVAFKRLGEICGEYLSKGSKVYIEGRIQTRKWLDKDGQDRYITEIVANTMKMLSPKGGQGGSQETDGAMSTGPDDLPFAPARV